MLAWFHDREEPHFLFRDNSPLNDFVTINFVNNGLKCKYSIHIKFSNDYKSLVLNS